jgi:hypothetical protein
MSAGFSAAPMRRLNVQIGQIEECIRTSLFAVDALPRNPPLEKGELLLLQLVKADAVRLGQAAKRVQFALVFERVVEDATGSMSREHWPNAGKAWKYILVCSETVPTAPFSLENLDLSSDYAGQANPVYITPADEKRIEPFLHQIIVQANTASIPVLDLLVTIRNHDRIAREAPIRQTRVSEHLRRVQDPWLGNALKALYDHRCQVCAHDFKPRYAVPYSETRLLTSETDPTALVSTNVAVVCPNHNAIIGAAGATFDRRALAFRYPNGLIERLLLRDHLLG